MTRDEEQQAVRELLDWLAQQRAQHLDMVTDAGDASMWSKHEADRIARHIATVQELTTPDLFWDDDGESCYESIAHVADYHATYEDAVTPVRLGRSLGDAWIACACLTVDEEGEPDQTEHRLFYTPEEAAACWPETLAAARAKAGAA